MKLTISKTTWMKFFKLLRWGKVTAKLAVIGTTITGAMAALSGSATTGVAVSAAGATAYAATKGMPKQGYEKTKHIPPGRVDKNANMFRQQEMEASCLAGKGMKSIKSGSPAHKNKMKVSSPSKPPAMRGSGGLSSAPGSSIVMRKK